MSLSSSPSPRPVHSNDDDPEAASGWGLLIGIVSGFLPAMIMGGRWWALPCFTCSLGWIIGAFIDRSRR